MGNAKYLSTTTEQLKWRIIVEMAKIETVQNKIINTDKIIQSTFNQKLKDKYIKCRSKLRLKLCLKYNLIVKNTAICREKNKKTQIHCDK